MTDLVPAMLPVWLHRLLLRTAHRVRVAAWRRTRRSVRGCNVLAFDGAGHVLLVRHSYQRRDAWMLPGGGIGRFEHPCEAATRELAEETGCRLHAPSWYATDLADMGGWQNRVELVAGTTADAPRPDGREIVEAAFFPPDVLPPNTTGAVRRRIALWREREGEIPSR